MKPLTREDLRMNEQAVGVATKVVREQVDAAARCQQVTQDSQLEAAGVGGSTGRSSRRARAWAA